MSSSIILGAVLIGLANAELWVLIVRAKGGSAVEGFMYSSVTALIAALIYVVGIEVFQ